jgi:hypothetical protein
VLDPPVANPLVARKPAFEVVRSLAECYLARGRDCPVAKIALQRAVARHLPVSAGG